VHVVIVSGDWDPDAGDDMTAEEDMLDLVFRGGRDLIRESMLLEQLSSSWTSISSSLTSELGPMSMSALCSSRRSKPVRTPAPAFCKSMTTFLNEGGRRSQRPVGRYQYGRWWVFQVKVSLSRGQRVRGDSIDGGKGVEQCELILEF
jgi:hypothetical protein